MDARTKFTQMRAGTVEKVGHFCLTIGVLGAIVAVVMGVAVFAEMSSTSYDVTYSAVEKMMAVSTVGLGVLVPALILVGIGAGLLGMGAFLAAWSGKTYEVAGYDEWLAYHAAQAEEPAAVAPVTPDVVT